MKITITKSQLEQVYQRKIEYILLEDGTKIEPTTITLEIPNEQVDKECRCKTSEGKHSEGCWKSCDCKKYPELPEELKEPTWEPLDRAEEVVLENRQVINQLIRWAKARE